MKAFAKTAREYDQFAQTLEKQLLLLEDSEQGFDARNDMLIHESGRFDRQKVLQKIQEYDREKLK